MAGFRTRQHNVIGPGGLRAPCVLACAMHSLAIIFTVVQSFSLSLFLRKKGDFSDVFFAFYGQRSVTAARATRSPWSIALISYPVDETFSNLTWRLFSILAQAACVRHACLRAPCVAWPLLSPLFSLSFFLSLFLLRFLLLTHFGESPMCEIIFHPIFWHI